MRAACFLLKNEENLLHVVVLSILKRLFEPKLHILAIGKNT